MKRPTIAVSRLCPGDVIDVTSRSPLCPLFRGEYGHATVLTVVDLGRSLTRLSVRFGDVYRVADAPPVHVEVVATASVKYQRMPDVGDEVTCRANTSAATGVRLPDAVGVVTAVVPNNRGNLHYTVLVEGVGEFNYRVQDVAIRRPAPQWPPIREATAGDSPGLYHFDLTSEDVDALGAVPVGRVPQGDPEEIRRQIEAFVKTPQRALLLDSAPVDSGHARNSWERVDRGLDGEGDELCSNCWQRAEDPADVPRTVDFCDPDGRFRCPRCGWRGAPRSLSADGRVVTVKL